MKDAQIKLVFVGLCTAAGLMYVAAAADGLWPVCCLLLAFSSSARQNVTMFKQNRTAVAATFKWADWPVYILPLFFNYTVL